MNASQAKSKNSVNPGYVFFGKVISCMNILDVVVSLALQTQSMNIVNELN
jgi:hypothetical protein